MAKKCCEEGGSLWSAEVASFLSAVHTGGDIRDLVHDQCQTDGTFKTTRLYCRLSASAVRRLLIARKGYSDEELPTIQTITTKLNTLGFRLRKVAKCRPLKKYRRPMRSSRI